MDTNNPFSNFPSNQSAQAPSPTASSASRGYVGTSSGSVIEERLRCINQAQTLPGKSILETALEPFNYDDFRARFDAAMEEQIARDRELLSEYKRIITTYNAWASVVGQWDEQVNRERRENHISQLIEKENKVEQYRRKSLAVLNAVESAFQEMEDGER